MPEGAIRRGPALLRPQLSVIIVHWNTPELLRACVLSLRRGLEGLPSEIIVVDNGSTGTAAPPVWPGPGLQVIHLSENRGFAAAANRGAALARGEAVLFLNSDVQLPARAGLALMTALTTDTRLGAVAARADCNDKSRCYPGLRFLTPFNHAAGLLGLARRRCLVARADIGEASSVQSCVPVEVPWVRASTMVVRRDAFEAVGGFDEGFFFYEEDEDLCWRLARRGYRSAVAENVIVNDLGGAATQLALRSADWPLTQLYAGQLRFMRRRLGRPAVLIYKLSVSSALAVKIVAAILRARRAAVRELYLVLRSLWVLLPRLTTKAV